MQPHLGQNGIQANGEFGDNSFEVVAEIDGVLEESPMEFSIDSLLEILRNPKPGAAKAI